MTLATYDQLKRKLIKLFQSAHYSKSVYELFTDWAEIAALTVHQMPYHEGMIPQDDDFERIEKKYMETIPKIPSDVLSIFCEIFALVRYSIPRFERDLLGAVYMELEIANKRGGQVFTPEDLCGTLTGLTLDRSVFDQITDRPVTFYEPACGSGGMLISVLRHVKEFGVDYKSRVWFDATDIDRKAFNMTYIQLGLLGVNGIVRQGNTLTQEMFESRFLPQTLIVRHANSTMHQILAMGDSGVAPDAPSNWFDF